MLGKYQIQEPDELPVKFLGGVLQYEGSNRDTLTLDYSNHLSKVEVINIPKGAIEGEYTDSKTHNSFRAIHGSLNFFIGQGYPLGSYELSENASAI